MEFSQRGGAGDYAVDDDDEKMEEFFAILRRFRHVCADRNRLDGVRADGEGGRPAKRRKVAAAAAPTRSSWVPKFEWEDFNTAVEFRGAVSAESAPAVEKKENTEEIEGKSKTEEVVKDDEEEEDRNSQLKLTLSL